ncbi:RNA 3'-terminal phosphate cyclase [bacterium HR29]|jgi:RNA 3'-terminal phosphate cyclase (ATP)|nr:RNA 3'-terminal phosphate cyclase [bacterium HR29]
MRTIDGSYGEGGGQILRTALALAMVRGEPVRVVRIRAGRPNPGLAAQHLATVLACQRIVGAEVEGARLGSLELTFAPRRRPEAGTYRFDIGAARKGGSAGAATLLAQTVAIPLSFAEAPSLVEIRGGTHVPWSPTGDYVAQVWAPALARLGYRATVRALRPGWYPAGGGRLVLEVGPARPRAWHSRGRGPLRRVSVFALASRLPEHVPQRMADQVRRRLAPLGVPIEASSAVSDASSAGAAVTVVLRFEHTSAGFSTLGERGLPSERVADRACDEAAAFLEGIADVDEHLADQLVLPAALGEGETRFTAPRVTGHLEANAYVIEAFGAAEVSLAPGPGGTVEVRIRPKG